MKAYDDILLELNRVFAENGIELDPNENDAKLDVDSLTIVSVVVAIEEHFDVVFPDDFFGNDDILCVSTIANTILKLENNKGAI